MRSYERNRVLVDQCTGCGGLFLDRGELEALVAAETAWHTQQAPAQAPEQPPAQARQREGYAQAPYGAPPVQHYPPAPHYATSKGHYGYRKRRSFLSDLFDD